MIRNIHDTAVVFYGGRLREDGTPSKAQMNTIRQMCQDGKFQTAFKIGRTWFTDMEKEGGE